MSDITYDFVAPRQIIFGWGRRRELGSLARLLGRRAWLVPGSPLFESCGLLAVIQESLESSGVECVLLPAIDHEPLVEDVDELTRLMRRRGTQPGDFLLAIGGGAAIDLAKALAGMVTNCVDESQHSVRDYLEGVGRGLRLEHDPLPVLAMPTTAGTGAEATRNAVISCYQPPFKKSLRDWRLMPQIALVDPELSITVPPEVTASTGMDAITQLIESYITKRRRLIPQALILQGVRLAVDWLVKVVKDGACRPGREAMSHAALLSGLALANSGLGMAHGVAAALGVHCKLPHGLACALMLPAALKANQSVCTTELAELAQAAFPSKVPAEKPAAASFFIEQIELMCEAVGLPRRLSDVGVRREQIPAIVADSQGTSMQGNPRPISDAELTDILEGLL